MSPRFAAFSEHLCHSFSCLLESRTVDFGANTAAPAEFAETALHLWPVSVLTVAN